MGSHSVIFSALIVALIGFAMASITIWSRREFHLRLFAIGLAVFLTIVVWFVFASLPGKPERLTIEDFRDRYWCATIVPVNIHERVGVLLLAKKSPTHNPEYLFVAWNMRFASSLQKSMRVAKLNGSGSIVYGSQYCKHKDGDDKNGNKKKKDRIRMPGSSGDEQYPEEDFTFYPDTVPPRPEKNYGPLYEGPIVLPQR